MEVKRYGFGFTLKAEEEDLNGREDMLIYAIWALGDKDCSLFGEEYCLGNAIGMAIDLYDYYTGRIVQVPYALMDDLKDGRMIVLYSHEMDEWEREKYEELVAWGEL